MNVQVAIYVHAGKVLCSPRIIADALVSVHKSLFSCQFCPLSYYGEDKKSLFDGRIFNHKNNIYDRLLLHDRVFTI